jgi:hypothetical protein
MPKLDALALWERYNRAMLQNAAQLPTFMTSFARLVADPAYEAMRMVAFLRALQVDLPSDVPDDAIRSFVESSLRHSVHDDGELTSDTDVTPEQRALRAILVSLEGPHDVLPKVHMSPESPAVERSLDRRRGLPRHGRRGRPDE